MSASPAVAIPKRYNDLVKLLQNNQWVLNRITGSHHIFVKPGKRCIPVAFHGGTVSRLYAARVLRQAEIIERHEFAAEGGFPILENEKDEENVDNVASVVADLGLKSKPKSGETKACRHDAQRNSKLQDMGKCELMLRQQKRQEDIEAEHIRRSLVLERLQHAVATGEYRMAVEMIENEKVSLVGSSDDDFDFCSDVLFYRMVALSEISLSEFPFNSPQQHQHIQNALKLSVRFMENFPDLRDEARKFVKAMQDRVFQVYVNGAQQALVRHLRALAGYSTSEEFVTADFAYKKNPDITQAYVFSSMDDLVNCLKFIFSILDLMDISLGAARELQAREKFFLFNVIYACVQKVLTSFDYEQWETSLQVSDLLESASQRFREQFRLYNTVFGILGIPPAQTNEVVVGIARHVRMLAPVYELAKNQLGWSRCAGVVASNESDDLRVCVPDSVITLDKMLMFMEKVFTVIDETQFLDDLLSSNLTRTFMFDTLFDVTLMANKVVYSILLNEKQSPFGRKLVNIVHGYNRYVRDEKVISLEEYLLHSNADVSEFRKPRYDLARTEVLRFHSGLHTLTNVFEDYRHATPENLPEPLDKNLQYLKFRFDTLLETKQMVQLLLSVLFHRLSHHSITIQILKQTSAIQTDFDAAENFGKEFDGEPIVPLKFTGFCESREAILAYGRWSLDDVFVNCMPLLLSRFVVASELKEVFVIDNLGNGMLGANGETCHVDNLESLAIEALLLLCEIKGAIEEHDVAFCLVQASSLHGKDRVGSRRVEKHKAKKYLRMIERFTQECRRRDEMCIPLLERRLKAVSSMLEQLKTSTLKRRLLPDGLETDIEIAPNEGRMHGLLKASQYIHQWTPQDVREVQSSVVALENVAEEATSFFHRITGGSFPLIRSMFSPQWKLRESIQQRAPMNEHPEAVRNSIRDVALVRDILRIHSERQKSADENH